jgi:hypothetical protein
MSPGEAEDAIELGDSITPGVAVRNYGSETSLPTVANLEIQDLMGLTVYQAEVPVAGLAPGEAVDVAFPDWTPKEEGNYLMRFDIQMEGDENWENNYLEQDIWVLGPPPLEWVANITINEASDAIDQAEEEGRTEGLDDARAKLEEAEVAYSAGNYTAAAMLAGDAWWLANSSVVVAIDIKPGSWPNSINPDGKGVIPVAILTTSTDVGESVTFDATTVEALTVEFGPDGASATHSSLEDVDLDSDLDMILHFKTPETGIQAGDTEACLSGKTVDGRNFKGCDAVRAVPPKGKGK